MTQGAIQIVLAALGSAALTALIAGIFARNKTRAESESLSAEAAQVIREAAAGMVEDYRKDNAELRKQLSEYRQQNQEHSDQHEKTRRALGKATRQSEVVSEVLRELLDLLRQMDVDVSRYVRRREIAALLETGEDPGGYNTSGS